VEEVTTTMIISGALLLIGFSALAASHLAERAGYRRGFRDGSAEWEDMGDDHENR